MKRLIFVFVTALTAMFAVTSCDAQIKMLKKAAEVDGVTSVYVSKAMLAMAGGIEGIDGLDDVKPFIKRLNGVEIVVAESVDARKKVRAECMKLVKKADIELLTEINDKDDRVAIYGRKAEIGAKDPDEMTFDGLLMFVDDSDDYVAIYIDGKIDVKGLVETFQKK